MRFIDEIMKNPEVEPEYKDFLDGITVISGDNVAQYFFVDNDQEYWDMSDFPNIAPPFEMFWLDFNAPKEVRSEKTGRRPWTPNMPSQWGFSCIGSKLTEEAGKERFFKNPTFGQKEFNELIEANMSRAKWGLDLILDMKQNEHYYGGVWAWRFLIDETGQAIRRPDGATLSITGPVNQSMVETVDLLAERLGSREKANEQIYLNIVTFLHPALLALSFMHCNNVELEQVNPEMKRVYNKNAKRRGEKDYQPIPYKVLNIQPMRKVLRETGKEATEGSKRAMHICRGNFAHYQEGRGLFGKYAGTFWRPMSVRGSKEKGVVTKDYNVKVPNQEE